MWERMKLYRYRLGIDSIIEQIDDVKLINDKLYIDEDEDYMKAICHQSDIASGQTVADWEYEWLCYNELQNYVDISCDLTRILKNNIHHLRKKVGELNARILQHENDIALLGECEIERE